jgi:hypothetical protein
MKSAAILSVLVFLSYNLLQAQEKHNLIEKLHKGEKIEIKRSVTGCFSSSSETLSIYKNNSGIFASYNLFDPEGNLIEPAKTIPLQDSVLTALHNFEQAVKIARLHTGRFLCTNTSTYTINYSGKTVKFTDTDCSFVEYNKLKQAIVQ